MIRTLDLFSGIGGISLGLEWTGGFKTVGFVEIEPFCRKVLEKHWPDVPQMADVREVRGDEFGAVDLICGGFPCQPHSLAGKRKASEDERDLWGEYARIIGAVKPRWVLAENVPGLLSSEAGRFFGRVLGDLAALGYDAEWFCLSAAEMGAHHKRDRVFIVAYPAGDEGNLRPQLGSHRRQNEAEQAGMGGEGSAVAHTRSGAAQLLGRPTAMARTPRATEGKRDKREWGRDASRNSGQAVPNADSSRREEFDFAAFATQTGLGAGSLAEIGRIWRTEPEVGRVADGVPRRVDRLRALGNAVVPQVAQFIGEQILAAEAQA